MTERQRKTEAQGPDGLARILTAERERHVSWAPTLLLGYATIVLDEGVSSPDGATGLDAGVYLCSREREDPELMVLYVGGERVTEARESLVSAGSAVAYSVEPMLYSGRPLTFGEALAWYAIARAPELADKLLNGDRIPDYGATAAMVLPRQDTRRPKSQYDPNSAIAKYLTSQLGVPMGELVIGTAADDERDIEARTAVSFSLDDEGLTVSRPISAYDREVHGAVTTLRLAGNTNVTPHQVARAMGIRNPSKNQVRKVEESIDFQTGVVGRIDLTREANKRGFSYEGEQVAELSVKGHLISAEKTEMTTVNGRRVVGYALTAAPLLYRHAAALGQVVRYPQNMLELGDGADTDRNLLLKRQLLRSVYEAKDKGESVTIRLEGSAGAPGGTCLFDVAGVDLKSRTARKRSTDYVMGVLDALVENGVIRSYERVLEARGKSRRLIGVKVITR